MIKTAIISATLATMIVAAACGSSPSSPDATTPGDTPTGSDAVLVDAASIPIATFDRFGSTNNEEALRVTVDAAGNSFIMGFTRGPIDLGGGIRDARTDQEQIWVASYTSDGRHRWSHVLARTSPINAASWTVGDICGDGVGGAWLAVVPSGSISVAGTAVNFAENRRGVVLAHLDSTGALAYVETSTTSVASVGTHVEIAPAPNRGVYMALTLGFGESVVGGISIRGSPGPWHIARIGGDGRAAWVEPVLNGEVQALASNEGGLLVVLGTFRREVGFGGASVTKATDNNSPFLLRIPPTTVMAATGLAIEICATCFTQINEDSRMDLTVRTDETVAAVWQVANQTGGLFYSVGRFNADGTRPWTTAPSDGWRIFGVAFADETVAVVGRSNGVGNVANHVADGAVGMLRVELSAQTGAIDQWTTSPSSIEFDTQFADGWYDIASTAVGWVAVGRFTGPVQFGGQTLTSVGSDAVVARIPR